MINFLKYIVYVRHALMSFVLLVLVNISLTMSIVFYPGLYKMLFDKIFVTYDTLLLIKFLILSLLLLGFEFLFTFCTSLFETNIRVKMSNELKLYFQEKLFRSKYSFFLKNDSGFLLKRILDDSSAIAEGIYNILGCFLNSLQIILVGLLLYYFEVWLLYLYIGLMLFSTIWTVVFTFPSLNYSHKLGEIYSRLYQYYWEIIPGIKAIKINNLYLAVNKSIKEIHNTLKRNLVIYSMICSVQWQIAFIFPWIGYSLILFVGLKKIENGEFSVGIFFALMGLIWIMYTPLMDLFKCFSNIHSGIAAARRTKIIEDAPIEQSGSIRFEMLENEISFKNINFSYQEDKTILKELNFTIRAGKTTGIVGTTGCGKTTIIHLLLKLFNGYSGKILFDGIELKEYDTDSIRDKIVYISQDPHIFRSTIRDNIDLNGTLSDVEINSIIKKVNLENLVGSMEKGLDTKIGKDLSDFSGGEKQRIAIARSLALKSNIIIFDEITSALDPENEKIVIDTLFENFSNKTMIIISHRQSNIQNCNNILVLKDGTVVEDGTHSELINMNGEYCKLFCN